MALMGLLLIDSGTWVEPHGLCVLKMGDVSGQRGGKSTIEEVLGVNGLQLVLKEFPEIITSLVLLKPAFDTVRYYPKALAASKGFPKKSVDNQSVKRHSTM